MAELPAVRRFEAAGFRAWPAERVEYKGSWQLRLTPGHPSRRANCVVPLDPGDIRDIADRLEQIGKVYSAAGIVTTIRETPLCPPEVVAYLAAQGWVPEGEVAVETLGLGDAVLSTGMDIIPSHDISLFVDACQDIEKGKVPASAMHRLFSAIEPEIGMFVSSDGAANTQAVALCVRDGDLAGLQQVAVAPLHRRRGLGPAITGAALKWAKLRGAQTAWLQVETTNGAALSLYHKFGFREIYRYRYWRKGSGR